MTVTVVKDEVGCGLRLSLGYILTPVKIDSDELIRISFRCIGDGGGQGGTCPPYIFGQKCHDPQKLTELRRL